MKNLLKNLAAKLRRDQSVDELVADVREKVVALETKSNQLEAKADAVGLQIENLRAERANLENEAARAWRLSRRFASLLEG
jgi:phage shock protein A